MENKIVLIDGNSILNRAFYGIPDLTNSEGMHTNAVYGFLNILLKILDEEKPEYAAVAFDVKHPTFRHEMYKEYKGTRKPMPEELRQQLPLIKEVLSAMNFKIIEKAGYEADDILGTIAKMAQKEGYLVSLVSGDRDLLQIATDKIKIRIPKTKKGGTQIEDYNTADVIEKYGITPEQIIDLKGLMGDASDNIPGVPSIGEKTAVKILTAYPTVEEAIENVDNIKPPRAANALKEHKDLALLSKKLATIKTDCELDFTFNEAKLGDIFNEDAINLFRKLEFKSLITRVGSTSSTDNDIDQKIIACDDFNECNDILNKLKNTSMAAFSMINDEMGDDSLALCIDEERVYVFKAEGFITTQYILDAIRQYVLSGGLLIINGLKNLLKYCDFSDNDNIFDISIASYLLNPLADSYTYDNIARNYKGLILPSLDEMLGKNSKKLEKNKRKEIFDRACAYDAYVSYCAYDAVMNELKEEEMLELYNNIEHPLIFTLADMEKRGIKADKKELETYSKKLNERIKQLETQIYELAGEQFNINSPKQLGVILFEKLNLPFAKKTKTGYSTSADIMEKLQCEHPVVGKVLEYRQLTKLKSTYADGLAGYIGEDGRIHTTFNQTITATGRISSTEPNLQNIPIRFELGKMIRKVFKPEPGYIFMDADYSQIELRVLAHMSGDEALINAYNSDEDIHKITASKVFNTPLDEVTPLQRRNAKAVNFGIVYGISSFGLGQDLNITRKEAQEYIKSYFKTYPQIKNFLDELVEQAKTRGYAITMYNRRRPVPELSSTNFMQRQFGERVAMNSPIQGSAADIIKIAMINVNNRLKSENLKSRLLLQIHDELLIETHESEVDKVRKILINEMKNASNLKVSLEVDANTGNDWYEAH